ncbi:hypothetical protein [Terrabacter sp. NPDC000476]|uniref:hypothetical protein n=1 Tax=Terrabacter sp. NPDC000476 TaxID=3154258 RepID=UPI003319754D
MHSSMTRATIIWFVGAAVVGAAAGGLHLLRSDLGGAHTGTPLTVGAYGLTALAALMLYHGVVVAAREQDAAAGPEQPQPARKPEPQPGGSPPDPTVYTFRGGKPVSDRSRPPRP